MESVIWTFAMVLLLIVLLCAMGAVGALMTAGVRQIVDEVESRESDRSEETTAGSNQVSLQPSPPPITSGRT
jgi:hypothetical protein